MELLPGLLLLHLLHPTLPRPPLTPLGGRFLSASSFHLALENDILNDILGEINNQINRLNIVNGDSKMAMDIVPNNIEDRLSYLSEAQGRRSDGKVKTRSKLWFKFGSRRKRIYKLFQVRLGKRCQLGLEDGGQ